MPRSSDWWPSSIVLIVMGAVLASPAHAGSLDRDRDPLVLPGADLPGLLGAPPSRLAGFRWEGAWVQVPIQVDERAVVDFGTVYDTTISGLTFLAYTDTSTFTGADPDPTFDHDDELAAPSKEAGMRAPGLPEPAGALAGSGLELRIEDPLSTRFGYLYLFESDGSLDPAAGALPIDYDFHLLSGDYKSTYDTQTGPNPEDTWVTTAAYTVHFSDRWIRNVTQILTGGATGVDILDRHKNLFAPGNCSRSENTFSGGEGAFIVNRSGPVRALRGYVGANSGVTTYRVHAFYPEREDQVTVLRVHPIPGVMDYFDYSPLATGMIYRNSRNPAGVLIDGSTDAVVPGIPDWEMVSGPQGTLVQSLRFVTDIPNLPDTNYYSDLDPAPSQCTGDDAEYGASGIRIAGSIPNTDPALGAAYLFSAERIIAYAPPDQSLAFAEKAHAEVTIPLTATVSPYLPSTTGVLDVDRPREDRIRVEPNPARSRDRLILAGGRGEGTRLVLLDLQGHRIRAWRGAPGDTGEISLGGIPAGVYFVSAVSDAGLRSAVRLVILRN